MHKALVLRIRPNGHKLATNTFAHNTKIYAERSATLCYCSNCSYDFTCLPYNLFYSCHSFNFIIALFARICHNTFRHTQ